MSESQSLPRVKDHERPLSPHLTIYKLPLTAAIMSITHRITGAFLCAGFGVFVAWLWIAAYQPDCYPAFSEFLTGICGKLLLLAWGGSFAYHFLNGVRHLFWDMGQGLELHAAHRSGLIVITGTLLITAYLAYGIFA